jgi:1-acyl-sn-glycerol-3-phosphate acyltransferase
MSDTKKYSVVLAENDIYESSKSKGFSLIPSLRFYFKFLGVVFSSSSMAKKGKYGNVEWAESSLDIFNNLEESGIKFKIKGMSNLWKFDGPAVFISNHMSTLETMILPCLIEPAKDVTFVVKQELIDYPYFGWVLRSRNPVVVGRSNPREDLVHVMEEGIRILKDGRSLIIFPQKTRSNIFDPESFNSLGVKLAKKSGAYVVPVALATDAWGNGKLVKEFGKINPAKTVHFEFGEPFKITSNGAAEHEIVVNFIKSKLIEWGRKESIIQ